MLRVENRINEIGKADQNIDKLIIDSMFEDN